MSFSAGTYTIAEPHLATILGRTAAGASELLFSIEWQMQKSPPDESPCVHSTQAIVSIHVEDGISMGALGFAWPETTWFASPLNEPRAIPLQYRLFLAPAQILAIERVRAGRGLRFQVELHGIVDTSVGPQRGFATCVLSVNPHDWAVILRSLGQRDVLLVGVDMPSDSEELTAATALRKAHAHLIAGAYDAAVGECRKAIESLFNKYQLEELASRARKNLGTPSDAKRQSLQERRLALAATVMHLTHLAMHTEKSGQMFVFSREDAAMAVAATAAVMTAIISDQNASSPMKAEAT